MNDEGDLESDSQWVVVLKVFLKRHTTQRKWNGGYATVLLDDTSVSTHISTVEMEDGGVKNADAIRQDGRRATKTKRWSELAPMTRRNQMPIHAHTKNR